MVALTVKFSAGAVYAWSTTRTRNGIVPPVPKSRLLRSWPARPSTKNWREPETGLSERVVLWPDDAACAGHASDAASNAPAVKARAVRRDRSAVMWAFRANGSGHA